MILFLKEILAPLLHNPILYLTISIAIIFFSKPAQAHINVRKIIKSYNDILKSNNLRGAFLIAPLFMGFAISINNTPDKDSINLIVTLVSILVSMLVWYISFFAEYKSDSQNASVNETIRRIVLESKEIANFEILESVFLLITCLLFPIIKDYSVNKISLIIFSTLIYWSFINLILNLLVLIKKHSSLH